VKIFLDENFPLGLERRLKNDGYEAEHVITIGWRGASDVRIRERLGDPDLLFLTQDEDFLFSKGPLAIIVISMKPSPTSVVVHFQAVCNREYEVASQRDSSRCFGVESEKEADPTDP
jgi:predicted nuclease of predicted toxin-antitoxin system